MDYALKYSRDQGPATVSARVDFRGEIVVTVSDTGIGMLGSEVAVALSRFGRVDDDTVKTTAGTGLGLPLTKALADRYDTRLEIHSEKGVGTVVNLRFPVDRVVTARTAAHSPKAVDAA